MKRIALPLALLAAVSLGCSSGPRWSGRSEPVGAGFRWSAYGPDWNPGPEYWGLLGLEMARKFDGAVPETVWIVGRLHREIEGTLLNFPVEARDARIVGTPVDENESILRLFDRLGYRVWLQVEPGNAPVEELIDLVLARYGHHPSVVGFGIDVEWYRSIDQPEGKAVTDEEARAWLTAVRRHDPGYRLFLKHWEIEKMPPRMREGLFFIDDSQILPGLHEMVAEFAEWGRAFWPAPVGFQYGYESDRPWWSELEDPALEIGRQILGAVPNARGLYWVDFTALEVFPPAAAIPDARDDEPAEW